MSLTPGGINKSLLILFFVLAWLFLSGCVAAGPVTKVTWLYTQPDKSKILVCAYVKPASELICTTPEDFALLQQSPP